MSDDFIGKLIDRKYRLLSELGRGAMGVVYRAEQLNAEGRALRIVAVKTLKPEFSLDPDFARRFLREVGVAMQLRNTHALTVYDSGRDESGQLYYVMEFMLQTLKEFLQEHGLLPIEKVVTIISQICEALAEAHSLPEPVVHRDLKPANIFIEQRQGREMVKIGDFGIAKILGDHSTHLTQAGTRSPGTPRYMAPEQWLGQAVDGRTDLYSLGVILHEMLTGQAPFSGSELTLMGQHLYVSPPPLPDTIPASVREEVHRLLAKKREDRPPDAISVRLALEMALEDHKAAVRKSIAQGGDSSVSQEGPTHGQQEQSPKVEEPPAVAEVQSPAVRSEHVDPAEEGATEIFKEEPVAQLSNLQVESSDVQPQQEMLTTEEKSTNGASKKTDADDRAPTVSFEEPGKGKQIKKPPVVTPVRQRRWFSRRVVFSLIATGALCLLVFYLYQRIRYQQYLAELRSIPIEQEMIVVPAGEFFMGCNEKVDKQCEDDEKPGRTVFLDRFKIDKTKVSVAKYGRCVEAGKCSAPDTGEFCNWRKEGTERDPINCVDWDQAVAFCQWDGNKRLPTEAEWEKAARGRMDVSIHGEICGMERRLTWVVHRRMEFLIW